MNRRIRVLIIDDSALVRKVLTELLSKESDMEVVGTAPDAYIARDKIRRLQPDVLTLDLEMPRMNGLEFLCCLMNETPLPVVVISSTASAGSDVTLEALRCGAVDVLLKPGGPYSVAQLKERIAVSIRMAARARVRGAGSPEKEDFTLPPSRPSRISLITIGASTGGVQAISQLLEALPPDTPGIVIGQHIPAGFSRSFAGRLDRLCRLHVREAQHMDLIEPGTALITPGDAHLTVENSGGGLRVALSFSPPRNHHRPCIDVMFKSIATAAGASAVGVLLTGMGADGAAGLLEMKNAGAYTIAQDESSSVVFGMPRAAILIGAVDRGIPLSNIPELLVFLMAGTGEEAGVGRLDDSPVRIVDGRV